MLKPSWPEFRAGVIDILPVIVAAVPIGVLWGTLAAGKGLTPIEAGLISVSVFAGAAQYVAIELWRQPAPWILLTVTVFIVNIRHVMMGASLSRHMGDIPSGWRAPLMFLMADENWAFSERRALVRPLTMSYYLGLALPMVITWTVSSVTGALAGRNLGDPAVYGFDFAFSALFIGILAGFWKGPRTGAVLAASAVIAAIAKLYITGAWYIVLGGIAGVAVAGLYLMRGVVVSGRLKTMLDALPPAILMAVIAPTILLGGNAERLAALLAALSAWLRLPLVVTVIVGVASVVALRTFID